MRIQPEILAVGSDWSENVSAMRQSHSQEVRTSWIPLVELRKGDGEFRVNRRTAACHNGMYHIYSRLEISAISNRGRVFRVLANHLILQTVQDFALTGASHDAQVENPITICGQLQDEILASVPQLLGYPTPGPCDIISRVGYSLSPPARALVSQVDSSTTCPVTVIKPQCCYSPSGRPASTALKPIASASTLTWPLWIVGRSWVSSEEDRRYCGHMLNTIERVMGIRHAAVMAELIQRKYKETLWLDKSKER